MRVFVTTSKTGPLRSEYLVKEEGPPRQTLCGKRLNDAWEIQDREDHDYLILCRLCLRKRNYLRNGRNG
jgi:hypothetical protein